MLRFCNLGSGSSGNATLVEARDGSGRVTRLLVDCGLSLRELSRRLAERECLPGDLDAVFVTHEHSDHIGCVQTLMRRHRVPVWTSRGTWHAIAGEHPPPPGLRLARDGEPIDLGGLLVRPYAVPHDAREPLQLTVEDGLHRLGILTDAGAETAALVQALQGCAALLLECNHDLRMLTDGDYPPFLKRRIAGPRGHLSNDAAAAILGQCRHAGLRHVVAAHLSERNNLPTLAAATLARALGAAPHEVLVADPRDGTPWLDLH
jgi:phosphoribosyl 1,2-cyclic phosphodiesterase